MKKQYVHIDFSLKEGAPFAVSEMGLQLIVIVHTFPRGLQILFPHLCRHWHIGNPQKREHSVRRVLTFLGELFV